MDENRRKMPLKNRIAGWHYDHPKQTPLWRKALLTMLSPLSWGYNAVIFSRLLAYQFGWLETVTGNSTIISVGNLTTGGTGKTPIVIALASGLVQAGKSVLILSRGYGAAIPGEGVLAGDPRYGDEACLIQEQVPEAVVMIGRRREKVLQQATHNWRPDFVILDDGFQYVRLRRDMNILLFDGEAMIGNGRTLPLGPLREPLSEIRRADAIFITRNVSTAALNQVEEWVKEYHPNGNIPVLPVPFQVTGLKAVTGPEARHERTQLCAEFTERTVMAFSGLARPESFQRDMEQAGLRVLDHVRYNDHHIYTADDVSRLQALAHQHGDNTVILTTDKDWPKVRELWAAEEAKRPSGTPVPDVYTLQSLPAMDGRWFYEEFLTQIARRTSPGSQPSTRSGHEA